MMTNKNDVPNRLINEKSPYLLQHAYNPVAWYPWSEEAFSKAKIEDKPIFLSIGYSTCHWCHFMERESFEDEEVASLLNADYVCIKVDREERPDIDSIYMEVCQRLTGSGGWPLTIFMASDKKPFFAGTYFPKYDRMGMHGLLSILQSVSEAWKNDREIILNSSRQILNAINQPDNKVNEEFKPGLIKDAFSQLEADFDNVYGGFDNAPKFPTPHNLYFLLRYWYNERDKRALEMVEKTLESMYEGGIYDHIGYGFSRYSTDKMWLVPHFEKMLYDNALLSIAYLETYQVTGKRKYAEIAEEIFTYILRDMTSPEGGFYSAEDADSEGEEGKFYIWSADEMVKVLGEADGKKFCSYYGITDEGNFEGKNIPNLIKPVSTVIDTIFINECREKLLEIRNKRVHPFRDDKILTAWNGLMIAAMAIGGRVLNKREYIDAAEKAADFIYKNLIRKDGRLLARFRDGEAALSAFLDDYAFLIWGLLEIYESNFRSEYLEKAINLNSDLIKYFWDDKNAGLFVYGSDSEQLIKRPKEIYDGATPSGNSVSALNFLRLARLTGMYELEEKANRLLKEFANSINYYPRGYCFSLIALLFAQSAGKEIVIVSDKRDIEVQKMINIVNEEFRPYAISMLYTAENNGLEQIAPFISAYKSINGKPTAYICQNFSCQAPVTDIQLFKQQL